MIRLDTGALFRALDERRAERGMSWSDLAREVGVSASTMKRLERGGRAEVDGVLAMVTWLGRSVESFARRTER